MPALSYGVLSGHGAVVSGEFAGRHGAAGRRRDGAWLELEQFHLSLLLIAVLIHVVVSVTLGLIYGVLLPTLPEIPKAAGLGRLADAAGLDGGELQPDGHRQPGTPRAGRMDLVHRLAIHFWHRAGRRR